MNKICRRAALPLALVLLAPPAASAPLPPPQELFAGDLAPLRPEFEALFTEPPREPAAALTRFDALLAKLPQPSGARGLALIGRASALNALNRDPEAIHAIEESMRLLPGFSGPLYEASEIHTFAGNPERGADLLLQASRIDPQIMRAMDDYALNSLLSRLDEAGDHRRLAAVSERLLEISWSRGSLATSDRVVFSALDARVAAGDVHGARTLIPRLLVPSKVVTLLTDKRYDAVRETALAHAGPRLANLWPRYLLRAEADWRNDQDGLGAAVYAGALAAAGADSKLITTFLPLFGKPLDKLRDESLIFAVSSLSSALAAQGRWDEAFQLYDTALRIWSDENRAQTLNLSGNRGRLLVIKGDYAAGLAQLDVVIARAQRLGGEVNDEAVSAFHLYRACALHRLGRGKEAATSEAVVARRRVLSVRHTITLHFCRDEAAAAKQFLIDSLESEESRGHALGLVQPSDEIGAASPWAEHVRKAWTELRRDPQVRSAALRYGYILSEPANAVVREPRR